MTESNKNIALALSGGGTRAMIFHLGVLKYLAEKNCFEQVSRISTVSGGSLVTGFIFKESNMAWPSSSSYLDHVYPTIRNKLCSRSMQWRSFLRVFNPRNYKYWFSRANILSLELKQGWGIIEALSDLPEAPEWSINGTTAENGKRFRFKRENLGDYMLGYAPSNDFPLSDALAVSAAFPGGIGPLSLDAMVHKWEKRPSWDLEVEPQVIDPLFKRIHLYDGGVYDNLGLEPLFDAGRGTPKINDEVIIASDAGSPLEQDFNHFSLSPARLKRIYDMTSDQSRALRVRTFMNYLSQNKDKGSYLYIDTALTSRSDCESRKYASSFPTHLKKVTKKQFDALASHGYKVAAKTDQEVSLGY